MHTVFLCFPADAKPCGEKLLPKFQLPFSYYSSAKRPERYGERRPELLISGSTRGGWLREGAGVLIACFKAVAGGLHRGDLRDRLEARHCWVWRDSRPVSANTHYKRLAHRCFGLPGKVGRHGGDPEVFSRADAAVVSSSLKAVIMARV